MSESILPKLAAALNDGTEAGKLLSATAWARHASACEKHKNSMTLESPLRHDAGEKALQHMIDTIAYAERARLDADTVASLRVEARYLATAVIRQRAEAEAIARGKEVANG